MSRFARLVSCWLFVAALAASVEAQSTETQDLAKASQNPVGSLINVPLQNNFNFGTGVPGRLQYVLNVQPVVPITMSRDWRFVPRLILPTIQQPLGKDEVEVGLGDIVLETFFATANPIGKGGLIVGAGPAFQFATASAPELGTQRWAAGADAVVVITPGHWLAGVLVAQQWSFAGESSRASIAPFTLQPFVNYNLSDGWAIISAPIITADWMAPADDWFIPIGGGISRTTKTSTWPVTISGQVFGNALRPSGSPDWNLRLQMSLLFPKR